MSLKKNEFVIACEHCAYGTDDGADGFVVTVPLRDERSGLKGIARLKCAVSPRRHKVHLQQWLDDELQPIRPPADVEKRLLRVLWHVGEKRVCGNRHLCPSEVVRAVERQNQC